MKAIIILIISLVIVVACVSAFACDDVVRKVVLIDSLAWEIEGSPPMSTPGALMQSGNSIRAALDGRIGNVYRYPYDPNLSDKLSTKQQLELLDQATVVWIIAHGYDITITLEYHNTQTEAILSAIGQQIIPANYRVTERHGKYALNVYASGLHALWSGLMAEYAEYCGVVIWGCYSQLISQAFEFGVPTNVGDEMMDGFYASVGTNREVYVLADHNKLALFWSRMLCLTSVDEVLDTYYYASMGDNYVGDIDVLEYWDNQIDDGWRQWLAPDPCNQCHKPTAYIREVRYEDSVISWRLSDHEMVEEVVISGYDSGEYMTIATVPCIADTGSVHVPQGPWSDITLHVYSNDVLLESSMPRFVSLEDAADDIRVIERGIQENGIKSYVAPSHYVVVSHVNLIQTAVTELAASRLLKNSPAPT